MISKKFGELEGYDTCMSMEHIYMVYRIVVYCIQHIYTYGLIFWDMLVFAFLLSQLRRLITLLCLCGKYVVGLA